MSRSMVLVFLLVILIITSQFEWKQQLASELDATTAAASQNQQRVADGDEAVKEKIILSQEKNIQRLNELVQTLQQQLVTCESCLRKLNMSRNSSSASIKEIKQQHIPQG